MGNLKSNVKTRDIFAKGALIAAKFIATKKNGLLGVEVNAGQLSPYGDNCPN